MDNWSNKKTKIDLEIADLNPKSEIWIPAGLEVIAPKK
jgi:hypothetical protein